MMAYLKDGFSGTPMSPREYYRYQQERRIRESQRRAMGHSHYFPLAIDWSEEDLRRLSGVVEARTGNPRKQKKEVALCSVNLWK